MVEFRNEEGEVMVTKEDELIKVYSLKDYSVIVEHLITHPGTAYRAHKEYIIFAWTEI
jgi:hypothetical protein